MLRLSTLGGVALADERGPFVGALVQRRRLALLARIAAAGERGVSRDSLAALLWPEADAERARHTLRQWLSLLRRDLGADQLLLGGAELRLNSAVIGSDVGELRTALARGDLEAAAAAYAGPFLDGFHVTDAPEFERWADAERGALAREVGRALETLAARATAAGRAREAADWWRRVAALDPLCAHAAVGYASALAAAGERAAALEFARVHEAMLREELEVGPDPRLAALVRELRAGGHAPSAATLSVDIAPHREPPPSGGLEQRLRASMREALGGRYELQAVIERTNLTTTFTARDSRGGDVVLRLLGYAVAGALDAERFLAQLARARGVDHPALVPLLEAGAHEGLLYLVNPSVRGESLRDRLARERQLGLAEALGIATRLADALAAAHASGVLHLDLKPRHVMLAGPGALLADVGFAPAITCGAADLATRSGVTIGTPAYISPEQAGGTSTLDARTDVYALGCILYHMLAGEPPFAGGTAQAALVRRLTETPTPLRTLRPSVPLAVESLVARMLERVPGDRVATMAEVRDRLRSALDT